MNNPFAIKGATLKTEVRQTKYRKEEYEYTQLYYVDDDGTEFTTTAVDEVNFRQVTNQYRAVHGIPYVDEIIDLRNKYGLSASKMSRILGFGENQYRLYEEQEVPSESNGRTLKACMNPVVFEEYVKAARNELSNKEYERVMDVIGMEKTKGVDFMQSRIYNKCTRGKENGYAPQSMVRLHNMLLFFINGIGDVFATKMNKLLFYADFVAYRMYGYSISGLSYLAAPFGPTPYNWGLIYNVFDDVYNEVVSFADGIEGTKLMAQNKPDMSVFNRDEQNALELVRDAFKGLSASAISKLSHEEDAWLKNEELHKTISFDEAFNLKAIPF